MKSSPTSTVMAQTERTKMVKDERPYIKFNGKEHKCYLAGYMNPVQHKWSFVIDGEDSLIHSDSEIEFFGMTLTVCFTARRKAQTTAMFNDVTGLETYIEAWQY